MPGRFFLQKFLRTAYVNGCTHAVIEATSEGARYFRHHCLYPNVVVVTNIAPEHIESHGSFENYLDCKLSLVDALASSPKLDKALVVNTDDSYATAFTDRLERCDSGHTVTQLAYNRDSGINLVYTDHGVSFIAGKTPIESTLPGLFSAYNILAALTAARHLSVTESALVAGIRAVTTIPGRAEFIREGQSFDVVVDYAHTAESLEALYTTFAAKRIIGVLGSMGGGRDTWKRKKMGAVADTHCSTIILTDEDPCDEDPEKIVREIGTGITAHTPLIIMNRREAIREAFRLADASTEPTAVLITGKGTDNSIKRAHGTSEPWSDAGVAREELARLAQKA
jgi:UDP-N-acetylmuramoyl-L-alanyl-D-glutamate--2,6-diaminopimelate ligase